MRIIKILSVPWEAELVKECDKHFSYSEPHKNDYSFDKFHFNEDYLIFKGLQLDTGEGDNPRESIFVMTRCCVWGFSNNHDLSHYFKLLRKWNNCDVLDDFNYSSGVCWPNQPHQPNGIYDDFGGEGTLVFMNTKSESA